MSCWQLTHAVALVGSGGPAPQGTAGGCQGPLHGAAAMELSAAASLKEIIPVSLHRLSECGWHFWSPNGGGGGVHTKKFCDST